MEIDCESSLCPQGHHHHLHGHVETNCFHKGNANKGAFKKQGFYSSRKLVVSKKGVAIKSEE